MKLLYVFILFWTEQNQFIITISKLTSGNFPSAALYFSYGLQSQQTDGL